MIRRFINVAWGKWADLHPLARILLLLLLLGLVGFFGLKPGYAVFRKWRIAQNLSEARVAVDESRMQEARDLSLVVLRSGDPGIEAYRILEKSTEVLRDPRHGEIARALMYHEGGSEEDKLKGFQGIVMSTPLAPVGQAWSAFPAEIRKKSRFAAAFAARLSVEHRWKEAAYVLSEVPEGARNGEWAREITKVLIGTGTFAAYQEAQRMISEGIVPEEPEMSAWVGLLEQIPVLSLQTDKLERARKILGQYGETARYSLMLARMECAANFSSRSQIINSAIGRWKESDPEALASFLRAFGFGDLFIATFPDEMVSAHPGLVRHLLGAQVDAGNWEAVASLLEAHPTALPEFETHAFRAIAAGKSGDNATGVRTWITAMEAAKTEGTAGPLLELRKIAEAQGMVNYAEDALIEAIRMGRGALPLYSDLTALLVSLRKGERENVILEICAIYLSYEPTNPVLLTHYAYLACLNELAEPSVFLDAMESLAKAFPKELPIQRVLGTVYLYGGQHAKALEILEKADVASGNAPPECLMALYTARVFAGQMKADDPLITRFPRNTLLPSERKKFNDFIRSAK